MRLNWSIVALISIRCKFLNRENDFAKIHTWQRNVKTRQVNFEKKFIKGKCKWMNKNWDHNDSFLLVTSPRQVKRVVKYLLNWLNILLL